MKKSTKITFKRNAYTLLLFIITLPVLSAQAQINTSEIDTIFTWATPNTPGCAMAASHNGKVIANRAYGMANLERNMPITPNTIFDIGSLQKQFDAAAILLLAEEGRLSLSDDIHKYIPELPDYDYKVTIDHLLTHTSGIRGWTGIANFWRGNEDALTMILRQRGLNIVPGEEWAYSNSNYVLVKEIVERVTGMSFSEFAHKRLFEPLGMGHTVYAQDVRNFKDRALAYDKQGKTWKLNILTGNARGGDGALLSTAGDLLIWNAALTGGKLGAFVTNKLQEPARLNNGRKLSHARGLFIDEDPAGKIIWYTGSALGYKSFLARIPKQGLSISILCNASESSARSRSLFANYIIDQFVPVPDSDESKENADESIAAIKLDSVNLKKKEGFFFKKGSDKSLRLAVNKGRLYLIAPPDVVVLEPLGDDHFHVPGGDLTFMSGGEFEMHFLSPDEFTLTSMEGEVKRYYRALPYSPALVELQAFAGRYKSVELNCVFRINAKENILVISLEDSTGSTLPFRPVAPEVFQAGRRTVHFLRNKVGKVTGLSYSGPSLRNIKFTQVTDNK